jgi:PKD repeat protein
MAVGNTYRVLRQAACAEVQRLWGEWRVRGESRPRRSAVRRAACKATVEALEPRQMLSVTASAFGASHVSAGSTYQLNLSASATGGTLTGWNIIWGDGWCGTATSAATAAFHTYASATNSVGISATAADLEAGVSHHCTAFTSVVVDASGTWGAHISGNSATEGACLPYTLYPSFCDVNGHQASTWAAYWGDSSSSSTFPGTQTALTHPYSESGCYPVTLVAYDADYSGGPLASAGSYSSTTTVSIFEATPYFGACGPGSVAEGSLYAVYDSFCDPGLDNLFSWAAWWGDSSSTTNISASASSATHSYTEPGSYCVTLVAFDEDHSTGSSTWAAPSGYCTTIVVNVCEAAATVQVVGGGVATVTEGVAYTMHLTFTDPALDAVTYWHVDWGDTSSSFYAGALTALIHNYANEPGNYTVSVQAYDEDEPSTQAWGANAYASSVHLTVAEAAQTVSISGPAAAVVNTSVNVTFSLADSGGDVPNWAIDWGDTHNTTAGATGSVNLTHGYSAAGIYTITATATDEDGTFTRTFIETVSDSPTAWVNGSTSVVEGSIYSLDGGFCDAAYDQATKGLTKNNLYNFPRSFSRINRVVPVSMEAVRIQLQVPKLVVTDLDGGVIMVSVQRRLGEQTRSRGRAGNQADDRFPADQWPATPVLCNEAEQPVLDLVPLAGAWRKMADYQPHAHVVRQALQTDLPEPAPRTVAAAVSSDQQFAGVPETSATHTCPPATDAVGGELRRVVVNADADPSLVIADVVDAIGDHLAQCLIHKVMHPDRLRLALGPPLPPVILEITDQFLLFRVDRHRWLAASQAVPHHAVDVAELGVAIRMRKALTRFTVGLQAVAGRVQQHGDGATPDRMPLLRQFVGQTSGALAGPPQGRFRVAACHRLDQRLQCRQQLRVGFGQRRTSAARSANSPGLDQAFFGGQVQFRQAACNRHPRQAGAAGNGGHTAPAQSPRLGRGPLPSHPFVHLRQQRLIRAPNPFSNECILHDQLKEPSAAGSRNLYRLFLVRP